MTLVALLIMLVHFFISSQSCAQEIQPEIQIFIVFRGSCLSVLLLVDDQAKISNYVNDKHARVSNVVTHHEKLLPQLRYV